GKVQDRTQLILDIFALHAKTPEAQTQVELAQLRYLLPRLVGRPARPGCGSWWMEAGSGPSWWGWTGGKAPRPRPTWRNWPSSPAPPAGCR
ncbi:hypothetical protein CSW24_05310, partial [Thermus scotoductus]